MHFEWTETKRRSNIEKHGIDFMDAIRLFDSLHFVFRSDREGEERFGAVGLVEGRSVTVIYHDRGDARRIISARRARTNEEKDYFQSINREA
jgi:uncharacterized protein